ncbi:hypothetical protein ACJRO7_005820 [Eucalyptus globulus]|uniref:Fe2OG dioxygenase domain-containing protein n=1 Tax=Eucalyptus globulus TaxID=34317 RepID=A0ABD3J3T0_EUCGL
MGPVAELKLPVIDLSSLGLEPGTAEWTAARDGVKRALESYGCFEARFEKVPAEMQASMLGLVREVFDLPLQTKLRNVSSKPLHGYVGQYPMVPLYESIGIEDADVYERVDGLTTTLWPEGHPSFRLRVMKYAAPRTTDDQIGLAPHTDKIFLTILCQNDVHGLQVQTKHGEWFSARPSPNSFTVMIGDSLYLSLKFLPSLLETIDENFSYLAWVNGSLHSPCHQVMISGNEVRYLAVLFSIPKGGYIIKAPNELVDEEHPLLFKPFDHMEFLQFFYSEAGQSTESARGEHRSRVNQGQPWTDPGPAQPC